MLFRRWRRNKLLSTPWPAEWHEIVRRRVPLLAHLPADDRARLEGIVRIFLDEKIFEGCGGQEIDDELRLVVAAQAALLLLHPEAGYFPSLDSILVYPQSFRVDREYHHDDGLVTEAEEEYLGESWGHGALVLSWQDIQHDTARPQDGYNVVLHEFAHQLDEETGEGDGTPLLLDAELAADWSRICRAEYDRLRAQAEAEEETFLDPYGAEDPAEFFAVTTETFFTIGAELQAEHPDLYDVFSRYYNLDPASWSA